MSQASNTATESESVIHEAEVQRQYIRIRIPATIDVGGRSYTVRDLSAAGACIENPNNALQASTYYQGVLSITIGGFTFSYPMEFSTIAHNNAYLGCIFQNIKKPSRNALRHIITAYLSGEVIQTNDMLNVIGRDNHTAAKKNSALKATSAMEHIKSTIGSLIFLLVGLLAFSYVLLRLTSIYLTTASSTAFVNYFGQSVTMPNDATLSLMIDKDTTQVSKGQILASYQTKSTTLANIHQLPEQTQKLLLGLNQPMAAQQGTITSPCDCLLTTTHAIDGQFLHKGETIFSLRPHTATPSIVANFSFEGSDGLHVGQNLWFKVYGYNQYQPGEIQSLTVSADYSQIQAVISTQSLPNDVTDKAPVSVQIKSNYLPKFLLAWL